MDNVPERAKFSYNCKNCKFENFSETSQSGLSKTALGNYGDNTTPEPELFAETFLTSSTVSFTNAGDRELEDGEARLLEDGSKRTLDDDSGTPRLVDTAFQFRESRFRDAMLIRIETGSSVNDGDYKIASRGVSNGEILLDDDYSLTDETAAAAGEVVISRLLYKPSIATGCPFCGTLNSK